MEPIKALPGVFELINETLSIYKNNYKKFISLGLVLIIITTVQYFFTFFTESIDESMKVATFVLGAISIIFSITSFIFQILFNISLTITNDEITKGVSSSVKEIFKKSTRLFWPYILVLIVLSSLLVMAGLTFLIIPGLILSIYISLAVYFLIIENKRGLSALTYSFYYIRNNWGAVFWRGFALVLLCLLAIIIASTTIAMIIGIIIALLGFSSSTIQVIGWVTGIISFILSVVMYFASIVVISPIFTTYSYLIYKHIKTLKPEPTEADLIKPRKWFKGLSIFGLIVTISTFVISITLVSFINDRILPISTTGQEQSLQEGSQSNFSSDVITLPQKTGSLQDTPYTNKELGFSINFPKNWAVDYNGEDVYSAVDISGESDASITIKKLTLPSKLDLSEEIKFMEVVSGKLATDKYLGLENVSFSRYNINSLNAYLITGSITTVNPLVNVNYYYIISDLSIYLVIQEAKASVWSGVVNTFVESVNTFKVI